MSMGFGMHTYTPYYCLKPSTGDIPRRISSENARNRLLLTLIRLKGERFMGIGLPRCGVLIFSCMHRMHLASPSRNLSHLFESRTHDLQSWIPCRSGSSRFCTLARYLTLCLPDKVSGKIAASIRIQLGNPAMEVLRFCHFSQPRFVLGYIHSKQKVSCTLHTHRTKWRVISRGIIVNARRLSKQLQPFDCHFTLHR